VVPEKQKTTTIITLEASTTDPWMLFLYALKAPATRDKYIQRLMKFLDFLGFQGTKEEKARAFAAQARADPVYAFNSVLKFFQSKREQIDRKEMAIGTVRNYVKSIKLFCNDDRSICPAIPAIIITTKYDKPKRHQCNSSSSDKQHNNSSNSTNTNKNNNTIDRCARRGYSTSCGKYPVPARRPSIC
jgi:hypothetical protein